MIELGSKVREQITGFEGIVTGRAEYLWGCEQYEVKKQSVEDDGKIRTFWFDVARLDVIAPPAASKSATVVVKRSRQTGGPQDTPTLSV